jgi:hypothetical protein
LKFGVGKFFELAEKLPSFDVAELFIDKPPAVQFVSNLQILPFYRQPVAVIFIKDEPAVVREKIPDNPGKFVPALALEQAILIGFGAVVFDMPKSLNYRGPHQL